MKIKDIQIDGFGVWSGLSVDSLPDGMSLFYGPNEAGKTTLMQFIRSAFYGFTPDRREKYLPPLHGGTPGGFMRVTGVGGGYEIRRHSAAGDTGTIGQLSVTSHDGLIQGQHRLQSLLGQIDEPIFTNVFAIGMRELQELSTLDDTSAADELYKLSSGLDRVSLVDVLRGLRDGRGTLVRRRSDAMVGDDEAEAAAQKLGELISRRDALREEIANLTRGGRRYSELAAQRRSGVDEVAALTERIAVWHVETKTVETAINVFDAWRQRDEIDQRIADIRTEVNLPDEAPGQLIQIDAMIQERRDKLEEVKSKRRIIREKAAQLPVSRQLVDLKGRIEAAGEQATWIEALEEQIERLDDQIEKAHKQLDSDAQRLGLSEDERLMLADGGSGGLPDLSRQTLAALGEPSKAVKEQLFLMKQARDESRTYKERADALREEIDEVLSRAHATDLQQAIRTQTEAITAIKHRINLGEHLDKLKRHYRDLERESVELTTDEALPIDRVLLLALPFLFGGLSAIYGLCNLFGIQWLVSNPDQMWGMFLMMLSVVCMIIYVYIRDNGRRGTRLDREDCERQIDSLRRQIREVENEREDADSSLPPGVESLELRLRDCERLVADLESNLPTYHNHRAALEAYQNARTRASSASDKLKAARRRWQTTLAELGLSESMSPSSVRKLADGYETLQASRRRVDELTSEREQRRRERSTIAKRIESLYLEAVDVTAELDDRDDDAKVDDLHNPRPTHSGAKRLSPLQQLNHLNEELSRAQHWIKRRRELKDQDSELKRQQLSVTRAMQRGDGQRRSLWAKCGVATQEQFHEMVDKKAMLAEMSSQRSDLEKQIRSAIHAPVQYEAIEREIEGASAADLQRRWDSLATRITETEERIATLRTAQGELTVEMKHLADDDRLMVANLELGCAERKIQGIVRQWQTMGVATQLLEDVCSTFERERQPETLRESSAFLSRLTDGKYVRIWTPLGRNQLKIEDSEGQSLPLEVLSRGTREAVFIALRLSLASAYARRGVMLPLILDDVLVNFDGDRAVHAARTLKHFAELGHQVMMFTCHQHIVDIFHDIDVQVRRMPEQGVPGRAYILEPALEYAPEPEYEPEPEVEVVQEVVLPPEPTPETQPDPEPAPRPAPEPIVIVKEVIREPEPQSVPEVQPVAEPKIVYVEPPNPIAQPPKPRPKTPQPVADEIIEVVEEVISEPENDWDWEHERSWERHSQPQPAQEDLAWAWYQNDSMVHGRPEGDSKRFAPRVVDGEKSRFVDVRADSEAAEVLGDPAIPDEVLQSSANWW
ncbi:MAG: AAA family ATPase [Planctomycetota bacterium]